MNVEKYHRTHLENSAHGTGEHISSFVVTKILKMFRNIKSFS